jgi:Ca2+-binding RTX toxin-like protein
MATYTIGNRTTTFYPGLENSTYRLGADKIMDVDSSAIYQSAGLAGVTLDIRGTIKSLETGIMFGDSMSYAENLLIKITGTGKIDSEGRAIDVVGSNHRVENDGKLFGISGIRSMGADGIIENSGEISASDAGIVVTGPHRVINTGSVAGGQYGITLNATENGAGFIKNSGTIEGNIAAIRGSTGADRIINSGTVKGDVELGGEDDTFIFKAGKVSGEIEGGTGDDRYVIHAEGAVLFENFAQGFDLVKASVSFTLSDNIEQLNLIGKANVDGTGNDQMNHLQGNAGRNALRGEGGSDFLVGFAGDDKLFGGAGADTFNFQKGSGRDTVMDYEAGIDEVQLGGLKGTKDFADMIANHADQKGSDLWITYGNDVVVLKGTVAGDLQSGDFVFG